MAKKIIKKVSTNKVKAPKSKAPSRSAVVVSAAKAIAEARRHLAEGVAQRASSGILISPDEVSGEYDASRALVTSLGGKGLRAITQDDLRTFRQVANQLGARFVGGITAKQVIDFSTPGARARANKQIHTAIPVRYKGGRVEFTTNAGPESKHTRHAVTVEFMDYEACVVSPADSKKLVPELIKGKIKLDCGCEDWRYRLRYIATKGKYAAGPWYESSFPKITNPLLYGVACKHILRVMALVTQSPRFKQYAADMIDHGRQAVERKAKVTKVKEQDELEKALKKESWRQRTIKTTEQKRAARKPPTVDAQRAAAKAAQKEQARLEKNKAAAVKTMAASAKVLLDMGQINQTQYESMMNMVRSSSS